MSLILLKPQVLALRNHFFKTRDGITYRNIFVASLATFIFLTIYLSLYHLLLKLHSSSPFTSLVTYQIINLSSLTFFILLFVSSFISAISSFFGAKDLPLLLRTPVSFFQLYTSRLLDTLISSSWMFLLFAIPSALAFYFTLKPSWIFLLISVIVSIPFLLIPTALSSTLVIIFVNIFPASRFKELCLLIFTVTILIFLQFDYSTALNLPSDTSDWTKSIIYLSATDSIHPNWLPSRWTSEILVHFLQPKRSNIDIYIYLLISTTLGSIALGYLTFESLYTRGFAMSNQSKRQLHITASSSIFRKALSLLRFNQQLIGLLSKEVRSLLRDSMQSIQLLVLLFLSMIYLYNFRTLHSITLLKSETQSWWEALLAVSNIALGGCVIAAIATRFVFPSMSLEGDCYRLLRVSPIPIHKLLKLKFFVWLGPISFLSVFLITSGALSIQASPLTICLSALTALAMSNGITGLGIGMGALFIKLDWENPAQISASIGSLLFMFLSMGMVFLSLAPSSIIIILSSVPSLMDGFSQISFAVVAFFALTMTYLINLGVLSLALKMGARRLVELEN